jgi:hypothetical protein
MSELKLCPFCGGQAVNEQDGHPIYCGSCYSSMPYGICENDMINLWNTRASGWTDSPLTPNKSGRYTVNSSYGVRDAYFTSGFTHGDYRWQDCETNNDEGMENSFGEVFTVYSWVQLPTPTVK